MTFSGIYMRRSSILFTAFLFVILIVACGTEGGYYYFPEHFADYLGLSEEQRGTVLPKLNEIQEEMIVFFREWMPTLRERERAPIIASDSSLASAKTKIWQFMREKGTEIMPHLSPQQQSKFSGVGLPDLELRELFRVQRTRELLNSREMKGSRTVDTAMKIDGGELNEVKLEQLRDSRTISIGFQRMSGNRVGDVSRGFPLFVQATLMDPALTEAEKLMHVNKDSSAYAVSGGDDALIVNLSLSTNYHESYLDLKRWIVYLETGSGMKVEPEKVIKRNESYLSEAPNPFRRIFSNDDFTAASEAPDATPIQGGGMGTERGMMSGFSMQRAYYTLLFPRRYEGKILAGGAREELKLIFLNEISGDERAAGSWKLE